MRGESKSANNWLYFMAAVAVVLLAGIIFASPYFGLVAAKSGGEPVANDNTTGFQPPRYISVDDAKTDGDALQALQSAIASGVFEQMSSAKHIQLQLLAGMKYEEGVLKPWSPDNSKLITRLTSFQRIDSADIILTALANPLVNDPAADATAQKTQSEGTVIKATGNNMVSAYNDSGSFLSGVQSFDGYSTSTNLGAAWTDRGIVPTLGGNTFGNPVLARNNTTGRLFLSTIRGTAHAIDVYRSDDDGVTFTAVANGAPGTTGANADRPWIAVDNFAGSGNGNVYEGHMDFGAGGGARFTRSTDGGLTWASSPGLLIAPNGVGNVQAPVPFVGSDHAVYVGYYDGVSAPHRIAIRKSTDTGVTFASAVGISNLTTTNTNGGLSIPAGYRSFAFAQFAASPVNAALLFAVHPDVTAVGGSDSDVFFN